MGKGVRAVDAILSAVSHLMLCGASSYIAPGRCKDVVDRIKRKRDVVGIKVIDAKRFPERGGSAIL